VARFLASSQRRANEQRAAHPATARRIRLWMAFGAAAWAVLALAGREPFRRRACAFVAWWTLTWLMLDWHIGMLETEDGRPRNLGPADACTLVRVWLVPAAADTPAPWMAVLAFVTDGLDGRLARAGEPTRLGRDLEGLVDAAFAAAALRGALARGWLSRAAGAGELVRLGIGFGYALWVWVGSAAAPDPRVLQAARLATPVRAAGLVAAGLGRRHTADALVLCGAAWSAAGSAIALWRSNAAATERRAPSSTGALARHAPLAGWSSARER